jgi:hypothetical protein
MKKQIFLIAIAILPLAFLSCRKEAGTEMVSSNQQLATPDENGTGNKPNIDPLQYGLDGWFKFDANLKDATGQLQPGISTKRVASFTTNRKGVPNTALKLDGTYGVKIFDVPQKFTTSLSVWVKTLERSQKGGIIHSAHGPFFAQDMNNYAGGILIAAPGEFSLTTALYEEFSDLLWHHLAITFDGSILKFYVDGIQTDAVNLPAEFRNSLQDYMVGIFSGGAGYWKGAIDDLRFYEQTIYAAEVQKLATP